MRCHLKRIRLMLYHCQPLNSSVSMCRCAAFVLSRASLSLRETVWHDRQEHQQLWLVNTLAALRSTPHNARKLRLH
jgi:hypothetical protein